MGHMGVVDNSVSVSNPMVGRQGSYKRKVGVTSARSLESAE